MQNWKDLRYLQKGNCRQQHAYAVLAELALWPTLHAFDPVLAGTIPLAIDLPASDLDIICEVPLPSQAPFARVLQDQYGHLAGFQLRPTISQGQAALISSFCYAGIALEVFG